MAFRLRPDAINRVRGQIEAVLAEQGERGVYCKGHVWIESHHFEVRGTSSPGRYYLAKGNVKLVFDAQASDRWALAISFTGTYWLSDPSVETAKALAIDIAKAFGWCDEEAVRLRRIDLAVDVAGYDIRSKDISSFVKPRRGRIAANDPMDEHSAEYWYGGKRLTGIYVCKGGDVQLVIYDKTEELERKSPDKASHEKARWREQWSEMPDETRVTRVEVRLRGDALREFTPDKDVTSKTLRAARKTPRTPCKPSPSTPDPAIAAVVATIATHAVINYRDRPWQAFEQLDRIWQYATGKWVRLVVVGDDEDRITRCPTDPRWRAVQSARFVPEALATPAVRIRVASKADVFQTFGTAISSLVATETQLSRKVPRLASNRKQEFYLSESWIEGLPMVDSDREPFYAWTKEDEAKAKEEQANAKEELARIFKTVGDSFARFVKESLIYEFDGSAVDALRYSVTRIRAAHARSVPFDQPKQTETATTVAA